MNFFVAGTDTGVGKTVVTALLAKQSQDLGLSVVTQKWVQSGDLHRPDLVIHDDLGGLDLSLTPELAACRSPYSFSYPASPHLASEMEGVTIQADRIKQAYQTLDAAFEQVIVEGAGGLLVPYSKDGFLIDIVKELELPVVLVIANKLGCLNHSLLSITVLRERGIQIKGLVFNHLDQETPSDIAEDNKAFILRWSGLPLLMDLGFNDL